MSGPAGVAELELLGTNRRRGATGLRDLPIPPEEVRSWAEYMAPAGFRGGSAAALTIPDTAVAGRIEDIIAKLAAADRDLAIIRATRHGLHVPPALSEIRG